METKTKTKTKTIDRPGFDVTCVIGRVEFDRDGTDDAYVQAFRLIGLHGATGTFTFPDQSGGTITVEVVNDPPNDYRTEF